MGENTDDQPVMRFSTSADWWASELASVLDSLDQMYNALALARHLGKIEEQNLERSLRQGEKNWFRFREMGPELDMLLHEWARYLRRAGPEAARLLPGFAWGFPTSPAKSLSDTQLAQKWGQTTINSESRMNAEQTSSPYNQLESVPGTVYLVPTFARKKEEKVLPSTPTNSDAILQPSPTLRPQFGAGCGWRWAPKGKGPGSI
jgi:hypothetical protein